MHRVLTVLSILESLSQLTQKAISQSSFYSPRDMAEESGVKKIK